MHIQVHRILRDLLAAGQGPVTAEAGVTGLNVSGGLWYNVPVSGNAAPAASSSAKSGSGGYGIDAAWHCADPFSPVLDGTDDAVLTCEASVLNGQGQPDRDPDPG